MEDIIFEEIKNDMIFYGVYSTSQDMWDGSDVLCSARKRFFETDTKQKKRSTIKTDSGRYNYSYNLESGSILKYKRMRASQIVERSAEINDGYYVELVGEDHKPIKRSFYNMLHDWLKTEYYSPVDRSVSMLITPEITGKIPAVSCKTSAGTKLLFPFNASLDKTLTQKLNIIAGEPPLFCVTSSGSFYFCTEEDIEKRRQALKELLSKEEQPDEAVAETEPDVDTTSPFIVDTKNLEQKNSEGFDLKNSREIHIGDSNNTSETDPDNVLSGRNEQFFDELEKTAGRTSGKDIEDKEDNDNKEDSDAAALPENGKKDLSSKKRTSRKKSVSKKSDSEKADNQAVAEPEHKEMIAEEKAAQISADAVNISEAPEQKSEPVSDTEKEKDNDSIVNAPAEESADSEEAAEPVIESIFNYEKGDIPPRHERTCSFAGECPFETIDKQIIESGGRQYYYFGDIQDGKRNGRGRTVMKNGDTAYEGNFIDDKRSGFGVYYYKSGKLCYAGGWNANKREGGGAAFSPTDGSFVCGEWKDDNSTGITASFDSNGKLLYAGKTENGIRTGAGITYNENDSTFFVGKYKDGRFLESGTQFSSEGELLYTGGYKNNVRSGQGTSYYLDGSTEYTGYWHNDRYDGEGTLFLKDGGKISGSFRNGKAHGKCTLTDSEGKVIYIGSFVDDDYNGTGRLFSDDGGYAEGRFVDGEPTGIFNEYNADKMLVYCGEWTDMHRNGRGIEYKNGEKLYEGEFENSEYSGEGKLYEDGNTVYIGSFSHSKREGFGVEYSDNGILYKGMWHDNKYHGSGILYKNGEAAFVGMFENGNMNGRINEISDHAVVARSLYREGERSYTCKYSKDGSLQYYGNMSGDIRNGMGCSFIACAEKQFEGIFKNDEPDKPMKVVLKELSDLPVCEELENTEYELYRIAPEYIIEKSIKAGNASGIYTGRLKNGLPNGNGTILFSDHRYTGYFLDGKPEGEGILYLHSGEEIKGVFSARPFVGCKTAVLSEITYFYS